MMVVQYGVSGMVGSRILRELVNRGHRVTTVVRNPSHITEPKRHGFRRQSIGRKQRDCCRPRHGPRDQRLPFRASESRDSGQGDDDTCQRTAPSRSAPFAHGGRGGQPRGCRGTEVRRHPQFSGAVETHVSSPCRRTRGAQNLGPRLDQRQPCGPDSTR